MRYLVTLLCALALASMAYASTPKEAKASKIAKHDMSNGLRAGIDMPASHSACPRYKEWEKKNKAMLEAKKTDKKTDKSS